MLAFAPQQAVEAVSMRQDIQMGALDAPSRVVGTSATGMGGLMGLRIGPARYEFLKQIHLAFTWSGRAWICWSPDLGWEYESQAETPAGAQGEWERLVHADFQRLFAKRPFQMNSDENTRWQSLVSIINTQHYRDSTPLLLRQIGQVHWDRTPYPSRIKWIEGAEDRIELEHVPAELAAYKPGQWVEADLRRHPITNRLLRIDQVRRISVPRLSENQLGDEWKSLRKADLPTTEWDWPSE